MNNIENIFTQGEGYCEYNQDQIKLMKERILKNLGNERKEKNVDIPNDNKSSYTADIFICKKEQNDEEEGDYILGLA